MFPATFHLAYAHLHALQECVHRKDKVGYLPPLHISVGTLDVGEIWQLHELISEATSVDIKPRIKVFQ